MHRRTLDQPMGSFQLAILAGLQGKPMYQGTVPAATKARRRTANRAAGHARKANR